MKHQAEDREELADEQEVNVLEEVLEEKMEKKTSKVDRDLNDLELEVGVRYSLEYVKREVFDICTKDQIEQDDLFIEDINEIHDLDVIETEEEDENVEAKQRRIKQKVLLWLISEKHIYAMHDSSIVK